MGCGVVTVAVAIGVPPGRGAGPAGPTNPDSSPARSRRSGTRQGLLGAADGWLGYPRRWSGRRRRPLTQIQVDPAQGDDVSKQYSSPPDMVIDPAKQYTAVIETTAGTLTADLFASDAPRTVNNFVFLAREGFYEGVIF